MNRKPSALPDTLLRIAQSLPSPVGAKAFYVLRLMYCAMGRRSGRTIGIRFGDFELAAPLNHPAVFWRYEPQGFNLNYVLTVKEVTRAKRGVIVDVGANIGDGVALLRSNGIDSPIVAVEGADEWFQLLTENTNGVPNVLLEKHLLGEECTENSLELLVKDGSSKLIQGERGVTITTLDNILSSRGDIPVAILKTDTDGFDLKVLLGARSLLTNQHPVLFIEVDDGLLQAQENSAGQLVHYLAECGYTSIAVWDNFGRWLEARSLTQGIADLTERYPGGPGRPYLDIAAFSAGDESLLNAIVRASVVNA